MPLFTWAARFVKPLTSTSDAEYRTRGVFRLGWRPLNQVAAVPLPQRTLCTKVARPARVGRVAGSTAGSDSDGGVRGDYGRVSLSAVPDIHGEFGLVPLLTLTGPLVIMNGADWIDAPE